MIQITDKSKCCGCNACGDVCTHKAITFKTDIEGFWYPEVDKNKCTINSSDVSLIAPAKKIGNEFYLPFSEISKSVYNVETKYIKETNNHVLYRVTPVFEGNNLLATGVEMEAYSIEDNGKGVKFNVFVYNIQDGIIIDYKTGNSTLNK